MGRFLKWGEGGVDWGVGLEGGLVGCPPLAGAPGISEAAAGFWPFCILFLIYPNCACAPAFLIPSFLCICGSRRRLSRCKLCRRGPRSQSVSVSHRNMFVLTQVCPDRNLVSVCSTGEIWVNRSDKYSVLQNCISRMYFNNLSIGFVSESKMGTCVGFSITSKRINGIWEEVYCISYWPVLKRDTSTYLVNCLNKCNLIKVKCTLLFRVEKEMATHSSILAWTIPMDKRVWRASIHEVAKSRMWLSN